MKNLTVLDQQKRNDYQRLQSSHGLARVVLFRKLESKYGKGWAAGFKPKQQFNVTGKLK
jgi:hypothetical protein